MHDGWERTETNGIGQCLSSSDLVLQDGESNIALMGVPMNA